MALCGVGLLAKSTHEHSYVECVSIDELDVPWRMADYLHTCIR